MKHRLQRGVSALLATMMLGQLVPTALAAPVEIPKDQTVAVAVSQENVAITEAVFPDAAFRSWLENPANINGYGADGVLTAEELANIRSIDVANQNLTSLQGIEVFFALETLDCKNNALTALDVSQNTALKHLHCAFNRISTLDVSGLTSLISLNCEHNGMTELDLTGCAALEVIYCRNNNLSAVDFSTNTNLKFITVFDNRLTDVDLSMLSKLEFVHINHNRLTHLDLSHNTNLSPIGSGFVAQNNWLETLTLPVSSGLEVEASVYAEQDPKVGYERTAWYLDPDFSQPVPEKLTANGQTLYAKWLPNDYTIYFSANGGSGSMASQAAVWDTELSLPDNEFSRVGYRFTGWEDTYGDGKTYAAQETVKNLAGEIQGDRVTLYAQWQPIEFQIAFDENGGSGQMEAVEATYDETKSLPECGFTPPEDMEFAGWSLTPDGAVQYRDLAAVRNLTAQEGETVTLYAVWREPIVDQYLQQLDQAFSEYVPADYTSRDWTTLTEGYEAARTELMTAEEEQLEALLSQAKQDMAQVPTLSARVDQVVQLWRSAYGEVIGQIDGQAISEENAASVNDGAQQAMEGLTPEFVENQTDLTEEEDCQQVAASAQSQIQETVEGLQRLRKAAQWAAGLDGLSTRAMSQVTATWLSVYESAVAEAQTHTAQLQTALLDALEQRAELAGEKQESIAQLYLDRSSYDPSQYSEEGIGQLDSILQNGIAAVEQAESVSEVGELLSQAQADMAAVPDLSGVAPTPPEAEEDSVVRLPVTGTTEGKDYTAQLDADQLKKAVETALQGAQTNGTAPTIHVEIPSDAAETVQLEIPARGLMELSAHEQASFVMETAMGSISLDAGALVALGDSAEDRTVTMLLTAAAQTRNASDSDGPLWAWQLMCDGEEITQLQSGQAEVQVPYTLGDQQNPDGVVIHTRNTVGIWSEMETSYDVQSQMAGFVSASPCVFTVGYDETMTWTGSFEDVDQQAWYYPAVRYVCFHGMMMGTSADAFLPDGAFSRAQMAQILYNLEGRPQAPESDYTDVSPDAWFAPAIHWATQAGVLTGYGDGRVGPDDLITREQLATMLYRYAEQKGYDTSLQGDLSGFADADAISDYARDPMLWAYGSGIVVGMDENTLVPGGTATRAQAATMMMRFHKTFLP